MGSEKNENRRTVPLIRFKGFTDAWEQRKLGDVAKVVGGGTPDTNNSSLWDGDIDWYAPAEIGDNVYAKPSLRKITTEGLAASSARILPVGTILFTSRAGIGKTAILNHEATTNQGFQSIIPNNSFLDTYFVFSITNKLKQYGEKMGAGSTFVEVSGKQMQKMTLKLPAIQEQKQISGVFKDFDVAIALHQRKLDLLQKMKKGYLQKLFPKNGEKTPEMRFAGFTNAWEQRKLGVLSKYRRGSFPQPYGNKEWYGGKKAMPFLQVVDVGQELRLRLPTKQTISQIAIPKSVFVPKGSVVVTLQGSIGRVAITQVNSYADRTLLIFESYTQPFDTTFWAYTVQQKFEIEKRKAPGGTIKTITKEALSSFLVSYPTVGEQKLLGNFLTRFDRAIALHQRKLEKLKKIKQALLQKMFV